LSWSKEKIGAVTVGMTADVVEQLESHEGQVNNPDVLKVRKCVDELLEREELSWFQRSKKGPQYKILSS
jgi:hypothetical protein